MNANIVVLPGDGIGPEVTAEAVRVLQVVARRRGHAFSFVERLMGGCSIDAHGVALTEAVLADCKASSAIARLPLEPAKTGSWIRRSPNSERRRS